MNETKIADMGSQCKEKEHVWTTDDIREKCNNWSLEADAELLKHLQLFSQNLLLETHTTLKSLDALESQLNSTNVKLNSVSNSFSSLSDSQFVENRVYEEEEIPSRAAEAAETKEDVSNSTEQEVLERLTEAMKNGFTVLNEKFETIKLPESDSEEEDDDSSMKSEVVLKLKNPYEDLVLPYLIGSHEFNTDDTLGIGEVASEDEADDYLSDCDKGLESEDSEPESDQTKVHQTFEDVEQPNLNIYKQSNLAEQLTLRLGNSPRRNENREGSVGSYSDKATRKISSESESIRKERSNDESALSSASSSEYVDRMVHDSNKDETASFENETEDLFDNAILKTKVVGGVKVMDVKRHSAEESQRLPANNKGKVNPKEILQKHNQIMSDQEFLFEDSSENSYFIENNSGSKTSKSSYEDSDSLFSHADQGNSDIPIFITSKKSFWLDTQRNVIDDTDNLFDDKNIFLDDDDDTDFLFSATARLKHENKKDKLSDGANLFGAAKQPSKEPSLFSESDIFSSPKSSVPNAYNSLTDKVPNFQNKNKTNNDDLFDDWDENDDLFSEILPKTVTDKKQTTAIAPINESTKLTVSLTDESNDDKCKETHPVNSVKLSNESSNSTVGTKIKPNIVDFLSDEDETDDLFATPINKPNLFISTKPKVNNLFDDKKLFGDSGSDDDLFSTNVKRPDSPKNQSILFKTYEAINSNTINNHKTNLNEQHNSKFGGSILEDATILENNSRDNESEYLAMNKHTSKPLNGIIPALALTATFESIFDNVPEPVLNIKKSEDKRNIDLPNKIQLPKSLDIGQLNENEDIVEPSTKPSPGKLNADLFLNIDPKALLPGSQPKFVTQRDLPPSDTVSVLQSVVKERPKIQVKRRPPTRKARHEAIRVSGLENIESASDSSETYKGAEPVNQELSSNEDHSPVVDSQSNSLFQTSSVTTCPELSVNRTDCKTEDNSFTVNLINDNEVEKTEKVMLPQPASKSVDQSSKTNVIDDWLDSDNEDDVLFSQSTTKAFSSQSKVSTTTKSSLPVEKSKPSFLFEENDTFDSDLLFSAATETNTNKGFKKNVLFDDEDDDSDIFHSAITSKDLLKSKYVSDESGTQSKVGSHSTSKVKLSSQQVFTDPLMSNDFPG